MSKKIFIGMPVYNGENTIRRAIDSLLSQSYTNFDLVISDNCSTDDTENICKEYVIADARVVYIRQKENIGVFNFEYLLKNCNETYFMWAAADDKWSNNFLSENVNFLELNPRFVASTGKSYFCDESALKINSPSINNKIIGNDIERILSFFDISWKSNGIFYSVMRHRAISKYLFPKKPYMGLDWSVIVHLITFGNINCVEDSYIIFNTKGASSSKNPWGNYKRSPKEYFFPFYRFTLHLLILTKKYSVKYQIKIILKLIKFNLITANMQFQAELYQLYKKFFKLK